MVSMNFKNLTARQILGSYNFSDRFLRLFACACAEYYIAKVKDPDPRSLNAIAVARRYALGEATEQELESAAAYASVACTMAYSASTAFTASAAYNAASAAYNAAHASVSYASAHATYTVPFDATSYKIKQILIDTINDLTELEKLML